MKLITVEARFSHGATDNAIIALEDAAPSIRKMSGCHTYDIYRAHAHNDAVVILQKWESMDAFDAYRTSADFAAIGGKLMPLMAGPPVTTIAEVAD